MVEILLADLAPGGTVIEDEQTALHFALKRKNTKAVHLIKTSSGAREDLLDFHEHIPSGLLHRKHQKTSRINLGVVRLLWFTKAHH